MTSFRRKAAKAMLWSWGNASFGAIFQVSITVVMARLLAPADFGTVSIASVFVRFLAYFSQMGFAAALVQRPEVENRDLFELSTLSIAVGIAFTAIVYVSAPAIEALAKSSDVAAVLRVMSFSFLLSAFAVVPYGILRRALRYKSIALIEIAGQAGGLGAVAIVLAYIGAGPWSIVGGMLAQQAIVAFLSTGAANTPTPISLAFPSARSRGYFSFGARHSLNTFLEFLYFNVEVMAIGRSLGLTATGYYSRAMSLSHLPIEQVLGSVTRVLFPVLARLHDKPREENTVFLSAFLFSGIFATSFSAIVFATANEATVVLLGARWTPIVPALKILSIAAPLRYLLNMQSSWLDAIGELAIRTKVVACSFALKAIAMLYALEHNFTLESMLIAIILPDLLWQLTYIFVLDRRTSLKFTEFSRLIIAFALNGVTTAFFMTALTYALRTSGCGAATILILQSIASVVLLLGSMLLAMRYGRHGLERHHFQKIPYIGRII